MGRPADEPAVPDRSGDTHSELSGTAGNVVQAGNIAGNVHFHQPSGGSGSPPRQLPGDVRGFVNRDQELRGLDAVLAGDAGEPLVVSLSVIVGTAGVGKTSLALHWAHQVRDRFPDGQLYANLRGYDPGLPVTPQQVLDRFLAALGVASTAIPTDVEASAALYRSLLSGRKMLILLDNAATAAQVRPLLPGTAGALVLVTSRNRLSGLVAREGARRVTLGVLAEPDAVNLLRVVTAGYRPPDQAEQLAELAQLCARLPLALRIAAERAASRPYLHLSDLIADLRSESALWDALTAEEGEESDAVRTVFAWSYRALPEPAARLFRLLGLHPGAEFCVGVAAAIAGTDLATTRHLLDVLSGAHLVNQAAPGRYHFHDLLRAYALDLNGELETTQARSGYLRRAVSWYLRSADLTQGLINPRERRLPLEGVDDVSPAGLTSVEDAVSWYEQERSNLVDAVRAAAGAGLDDLAWQLAVVLRALYMRFNPFDDWITTGTIGLVAARRLGNRAAEADLLEGLGMAYTQAHQLERGAEQHRAALVIRQELGDQEAEALSLNDLGLIGLRTRQLSDAAAMFERCRAVFAELGHEHWEAVATANLAEALAEAGEHTDAERLVQVALDRFRSLDDRGGEGNALRILSAVARAQGAPDDALQHGEQAVAIARDHHNQVWEGYWLLELGAAQLAAGDEAGALTSYQRAAVLHRRIGDRFREARSWDGTGAAYVALDRPQDARDFHRRAVAVYREFNDPWRIAVSLHRLATAERLAGSHSSAAGHWREALPLLSPFADATAQELAAEIRSALDRSAQ